MNENNIPEEEKLEEPKRDIAKELHELNKTLKDILREIRKRK